MLLGSLAMHCVLLGCLKPLTQKILHVVHKACCMTRENQSVRDSPSPLFHPFFFVSVQQFSKLLVNCQGRKSVKVTINLHCLSFLLYLL